MRKGTVDKTCIAYDLPSAVMVRPRPGLLNPAVTAPSACLE